MAAHDSLGEQFSPQIAMAAEAVRRHASREAGVAHDDPAAPQVTGVREAEMPRDKYHPLATHHITVTHETPGATLHHVYGVDPSQEYMHNHTTAHVVKSTGRATTAWNPG